VIVTEVDEDQRELITKTWLSLSLSLTVCVSLAMTSAQAKLRFISAKDLGTLSKRRSLFYYLESEGRKQPISYCCKSVLALIDWPAHAFLNQSELQRNSSATQTRSISRLKN
jgi:hypothetical protein